ncbi:nose resistant to fluoxetine protein 6-like [Aphomia sociella]
MKLYPWITILLLGLATAENFTINSLKSIISIGERKSSLTNFDLFKTELSKQQWEDDTRPCLNAMMHAFENAKNFTTWAVWLLDGFQFPTGQLYGSQYHFGNYDQCVNAPWINTHSELRTKYCLADVTVSGYGNKRIVPIDPYESAYSFFKLRTAFNRNITSLSLGACIPAACNNDAFIKITRAMLLQSHLSPIVNEVHISVDSCQLTGAPPDFSVGFYAFIIIVALIFITTIACTIYVNYINKNDESYFGKDLAECFCMEKNTNELTIIRADEITSMNIMRVGSTVFINFYHITSGKFFAPVIDGLYLDNLMLQYGAVFIHIDIIVDTFLTISGILLMKKMMTDKTFKPLKLVWNRYIRLFGVLTVIISFMAFIYKYTGDGPAWLKLSRAESDYCLENGWLNLLMLNNYILLERSCFTASWFLATDFQLMVASVFLFFLWKMNKVFGSIIAVLVTVFALLAPGLITYYNNLGPAYLEVGTLLELRNNPVFNNVYIPSHTRAAPYIVGMIVGYILAVYKPANYRKVISTKLSFLGIILSLLIFAAVLYYGYCVIEFEPLSSAIFIATNRMFWSIAIATIIICHEYGNLPIIDGMFKWFPLVPLSRLTFGVYMSHVVLVFTMFFSTKTPHTSGILYLVLMTLAITVSAYIISYVMWLTIEAPIININNLLFGSKKNKPIQANNTNGTVMTEEKKQN